MHGNDDERAAVAQLCDHLLQLRREIERYHADARQQLADIEAEARAGRPIRGLLSKLPADPEENLRELAALPRLGPGRASEERFGCPDDLCDRTARTTPAGPLPRCWLTGRFMARRAS